MIDFRYHLVSLVSVFLALAVGIVLGAGPLQGSIGETLTQSVEQLRQEKETLHDELATETTAVQNRDAFLAKVAPQLISGELTGRSVVVITLPGTNSDDAKDLATAVDTAGGTVTGQVGISSDWTDADATDARQKAVEAIAAEIGESTPSGDPQEELDAYLARALVGTGSGVIQHGTVLSRAVVKELKSDKLISVKGDLGGLAGSAIVLAPPVDTSGSQPTPTPSVAESLVTLTTRLDLIGGGTVVTGPPSSATSGGLIWQIRKDDDATKQVSTVDSGSTPTGVITAILALHEQVAGATGQYGFGAGASGPLPATATTGSAG
jgi:hypothetical protein